MQPKPKRVRSPIESREPKWKSPNRTLTDRARQIVREERRAAGLTKPEILAKALHELLRTVHLNHPFMDWLSESPERIDHWNTLVLKGVAADEALLQIYNKANGTNLVEIPRGWIKRKRE